MKPWQIIAIAGFAVMSIALITASVYVFFWTGNGVATTYEPNNGATGSYGAYPNGMMGGHMGGMMGGNWGWQSDAQTSVPVQNPALPLWVGFAVLIVGVVAGTGSLAYFLEFTRLSTAKHAKERYIQNLAPNAITPYASISKTLTEEERQFLAVLKAHDGKYLQKYIKAEMGISRLKTHRIAARLAERGIITLEKSGNSNEVHLSSWLQNSNVTAENPDQNQKGN